MREPVSTPLAPAPVGPYSQGIVANGMLFVAGQVPVDPATGQVVEGGIAAQVDRALTNLLTIAREAGCAADDAVRVGVFLKDVARDFAEFNQVYARYFPGVPPARTTVQVPLPGFLIEVDAVFVQDRQ